MVELIQKYRLQLLLLILVMTLLYFWPGIEMYDSTQQYQQALQGQYTDHHPPLMAFFWRLLSHIYPGSGPIYLWQLLLIYSAIAVLFLTTDHLVIKHRWIASTLLLLVPVYPQILIYEVVILKDVQFAAAFLCAGAVLAFYTTTGHKLPVYINCLILVLLFYGTAIKYQAQFCLLPYMIWWMALLFKRKSYLFKTLIGGMACALLISGVSVTNRLLVPMQNKSYAWQYVKLYDLAAISIKTKHDLIPYYNKTEEYTFDKLLQRFSYPAIDTLVFMSDPLLTITKEPAQMSELNRIWRKTIMQYPALYLKHRLNNMRYILLARPAWDKAVVDVPIRFTNGYEQDNWQATFINYVVGGLFYLFMSPLPMIILGAAYLTLGIYSWRKTLAAPILCGFSSVALLLVICVFFMSMAGTPRYLFMSLLLIHAEHCMAYACIMRLRIIRLA